MRAGFCLSLPVVEPGGRAENLRLSATATNMSASPQLQHFPCRSLENAWGCMCVSRKQISRLLMSPIFSENFCATCADMSFFFGIMAESTKDHTLLSYAKIIRVSSLSFFPAMCRNSILSNRFGRISRGILQTVSTRTNRTYVKRCTVTPDVYDVPRTDYVLFYWLQIFHLLLAELALLLRNAITGKIYC